MEAWVLIFQTVINGMPYLVSHFFVASVVFVLGVWLYILVTPMKELKLIREGNTAAAVSFFGACFGIVIPVAACLASSINVADIIIWGVISVGIQIICFRVVDLFLKDLPKRIEKGEISSSVVLMSFKISIALLNAAAVGG